MSSKVTAHKSSKKGHFVASQLTWKNSADSYGFKTMSDGKHAWFVSTNGIHYRRVPASHLYLSTRCRALASASKPLLKSCHRKKRAKTPSKRKAAKSPAKKRKASKSPAKKRKASKSPAKKAKSPSRNRVRRHHYYSMLNYGTISYGSPDGEYILFASGQGLRPRFYRQQVKGIRAGQRDFSKRAQYAAIRRDQVPASVYLAALGKAKPRKRS